MTIHTRRRILQSMLAAPALAGLTPALRAFADEDPLIDSAAKALDIFDFERLARAKLPPAHFGYLKTGVDGDATLHANDAGFCELRPARSADRGLSRIDTSVNLFGTTWDSPIFLDPVGSQRAFHPDGEIATAQAARSRKHLQILSTVCLDRRRRRHRRARRTDLVPALPHRPVARHARRSCAAPKPRAARCWR